MRRLALLAAVLVAALSALSGAALGASRFYTNNYGGPESIGGFEMEIEGTTTPLAGSPFAPVASEAVGPNGIWGLAFTPDGTRAASSFLFKGGVQAYAVTDAGALTLAGTPTFLPSATGLAISPDGRFAFVPTRDFPPNPPGEGIYRFAIGADGSLTSLGAPGGNKEDYADVAISPDGRFLFAAQGNTIERFAIGADGSLTSLGTTPAPLPFFLSVSPDGRFLFLSMGGGSGMASFVIGPAGELTQAGTTIEIAGGSGRIPAVAPGGRHFYLPDYNKDVIFTFGIAEDGTPGIIGETPVENPEAVGVSPNGRHLVYYRAGTATEIGVAEISLTGVPVILPETEPWNTGEPERIVFQPRAEASCLLPLVYNGQSTLCRGLEPVQPSTPGPVASSGQPSQTTKPTKPANPAPEVGKPRAVPRKFVPKLHGKGGTSFRYTVSEEALVRFKIERKQGKRFKKLGSREQIAKAGANRLRWNGKIKGKALPPGAYRATVIATDAAGARSLPKVVGFRILPLPALP